MWRSTGGQNVPATFQPSKTSSRCSRSRCAQSLVTNLRNWHMLMCISSSGLSVCLVSTRNMHQRWHHSSRDIFSIEEGQKQYSTWKHCKRNTWRSLFSQIPAIEKRLFPALFSYPWTLDFVLANSIFTHSSLLCIVLRASCPQSTSCSIEVLVLCETGLSAMSLQGERAEFWVESSIVCGATQSHITKLKWW